MKKTNITYKITFTDRKEQNLMPYYYIGSKSNCTVKDGKIYGDRGLYETSSFDCKNMIQSGNAYEVEVLFESEKYEESLSKECELHIFHDVVADPRFLNKTVAMVNNYHNPDYATYKHTTTGKSCRLPRNHPMVLSGEYVGVTKGAKMSDEYRANKVKETTGEKNPFFGKKHTNETKDHLSKVCGDRRNQEAIDRWVEVVAKAPKSPEHRGKIGRKGLIMLKNINTGECVRVKKEEASKYDSSVWMNPVKAKKILKERSENDQVVLG